MLERSTEVFCYARMKPRSFHDWTRFWTCNVSVSHALVRAVGGFDESFRHYGCEDTDLALRLDARGSRVWFEDTARAHHRHLLDFDALERRQLTVARAWVRLFKTHPRAMEHPDWTVGARARLRECQRYADARNPDLTASSARRARCPCSTSARSSGMRPPSPRRMRSSRSSGH
jgi:GT2 family glycosyltransferase